jgi:BirA family transcriptional regulator, biotin operon repressor / biotin---[acetyl-CoA-carboxylase] ligase
MQHNWPIISLKRVDSTNNYARLLIDNNELTDETVICTAFQQQGRGQQNNSWESEAGKNLTFTLVLFTKYLKAEKQFYLAQTISIGIVNFLKSHKIDAQIKWPNDIYEGERKIAGILIENSILNDTLIYSLVGIGLNVNQQNFSSNLSNVQSMKNVTLKEYDLNELLNQLLIKLKIQVERLRKNEYVRLKNDYIRLLYKFDRISQFSVNGKIFSGKIIDVEENGQLLILTDKGKKLGFMFKEVQFVS